MIVKPTLADLKLELEDTNDKLYVPVWGLTKCKPENVAFPALEVVAVSEPVLGYTAVLLEVVSTEALESVV